MKKKIVVIDDDQNYVEFIRTVLESRSYQVFSAADGEEGLERIKQVEPDLIILDVMMGTTGEGFWISQKLRSKDSHSEYASYSQIPILMITAIREKTGLDFSLDTDKDYIPVDDYAEKPIEPQKLLEKVEHLLRKSRG